MPSLTYNEGALALEDGSVDWAADDIEFIYVKNGYTPNQDDGHAVLAAAEISGVTGYTGGWGGSGRQLLASKTRVKDNATNRIVYDAADPVTRTIGPGDTIGGVIIMKKGAADDTTAVLLFYLATAATPTNGSDIDFAFDATGIRYLQQ